MISRNKQVIKLTLVIFFALCSCKTEKFNEDVWKNDDLGFYPERRYMVKDLIDSKIIEKKYIDEVIDILGDPQITDTNANGEVKYLYYFVQISHGFNIDPLYVKNLKIEFDTLNKVSQIEIAETDDRRGIIEKILTK